MSPPVTRPFRGISAPERRLNRRRQLVEAAFEIVGTDGAGRLTVGEVCAAAGLTKRYFYESFGSIDEMGEAVVDHAVDLMVERTEPFRPGTSGGSVRAAIKAFIEALVDDGRLARVLITETQAGALSRYRGRIVDAGVAALLPIDQLAGSQTIDNRRFIAYAQMGAFGEVCVAWHNGAMAMGREDLVERLVDLFGKIARTSAPGS
jgi:AcrR family transcriptional regulator